MSQPLYLAIVAIFCLRVAAASVGCLDESGSPVDWWVIIKSPRNFNVCHRTCMNLAFISSIFMQYMVATSFYPQLVAGGHPLDEPNVGTLSYTMQQVGQCPI